VSDERPDLWDCLDDLAAHAAYELRLREMKYPPMIVRGEITAEAVDRDMEIWRTIAAEWVDHDCARTVPAADQRAAIAEARARAGERLADLHRRLPDADRQRIATNTTAELQAARDLNRVGKEMDIFLRAERRIRLLEALHWWARPTIEGGHGTTRAHINELNAAIRAAFPRKEAA
jgi:hypothetical protein